MIHAEYQLPNLFGDEVRLKQILINLVKNALKFTKQGSVKIKAVFNTVESLLEVQVKDTGVGIDKTDQAKLFKKFGKLERTADINPNGIGLGLALCESIVKANHG